MEDPQDKRKFKRFLLPFAVYEEIGGEHISGVSDVWDVGHGGFRILSPVALKKDTVLEFKITVPKVLDIVCEGSVRWNGAASDQTFWVGLCFTRINSQDKMALLDYAYDSWIENEKGNHTDPA